jgi:hypothetical protein
MLGNPDFNKIMVWRRANCEILINNWKNFLAENEKLSTMIQKELQKKEH